jgi:hypothetical protein
MPNAISLFAGCSSAAPLMAPEESLLSEFAIPEAPVVGRQLTLKSDSRDLIRMCVQLARQNEAVIPLTHPIHKWVNFL